MGLVVIRRADVVDQVSDGTKAERAATRLVRPCFDAAPAEERVQARGDDRLRRWSFA